MIYSKETILSKNGKTVPIFKSGKPAHSKYNPDLEKLPIDIDFEGCVVVSGIAGGFHIKNLLLNPKIKLIIALEADKESLDFCKSLSEVHFLLEDNRIVFCTLNELSKTLCEYYLPVIHGNITLVFQRAWENENIKIREEVQKESQDALKKISADFSVQSHFGFLWHRNILLNLKFFSETSLSCIKNIHSFFSTEVLSKTAAIIAAGPTLDLSIEEIKKGDFFIIATDTAFGSLIGNGITPDVVISIDAQHISSEHFLCCENETKTLFIFDLCANPESARLVNSKGNKIQFIKNNHPLSLLLREKTGIKKIESGAGTVTIAAADWARKTGFRKIKFFGADFSYCLGKPYAKGTYLEHQFSLKNSRIETEETQNCALMFRTNLQKLPGYDRHYSTEILQSYQKSLFEWAKKYYFKFQNGLFITEKITKNEDNKIENFCYTDFIKFFSNGIKDLIDNGWDSTSLLNNEVGLSLLPFLSSLKNTSFFEGLKLAYNRTLRYN